MRVLLGILLSIVSFAPVKGNVTNVGTVVKFRHYESIGRLSR